MKSYISIKGCIGLIHILDIDEYPDPPATWQWTKSEPVGPSDQTNSHYNTVLRADRVDLRLFVAVHMSVLGTFLPSRDVRYAVDIGGEADIARTSPTGR